MLVQSSTWDHENYVDIIHPTSSWLQLSSEWNRIWLQCVSLNFTRYFFEFRPCSCSKTWDYQLTCQYLGGRGALCSESSEELWKKIAINLHVHSSTKYRTFFYKICHFHKLCRQNLNLWKCYFSSKYFCDISDNKISWKIHIRNEQGFIFYVQNHQLASLPTFSGPIKLPLAHTLASALGSFLAWYGGNWHLRCRIHTPYDIGHHFLFFGGFPFFIFWKKKEFLFF